MDNPLYSMFLFASYNDRTDCAAHNRRSDNQERQSSHGLRTCKKEKWLTCRIIAGYSATSSYCWDLLRRYAHIWL